MGLYENIKDVAQTKNISIAQIERETKMSNGSISKWSKNAPAADKLSTVAKYLNVSTDYLLGVTNLTNKEIDKGEMLRGLMQGDNKSINFLKKISKLNTEEYETIEKFVDLLIAKK
ncbi:hypothetical protein IGJ55_002129 [Enterococcus sp. AZ170]|uniref:helix-turn-helix domain-containing protein n=1 Tax=unclassified Enterococcus TaxID=2608891 RepID=UPI003D2D4754